MKSDQITADECARLSADSMWKNDEASRSLGLVMQSVKPGHAVFSLRVEKRHTNGHDICHGGFIFTLADTAFAFACNSYNQITVAHQNSITFLSPGQPGDTLTATATEVSRRGRSGVYDVTVVSQNGETIALFRGHSRTLKGQLFEP